MKYIVAIIQPDRLSEVLDKLEEKEIHLVTVSNVVGRGRQKGIAEVYRSHKEAGSLLRKMKLEIAVNEDFVQATIDAIIRGSPDGGDRGRQDLCAGPGGVYPHPHGGNGESGHRIGKVETYTAVGIVGAKLRGCRPAQRPCRIGAHPNACLENRIAPHDGVWHRRCVSSKTRERPQRISLPAKVTARRACRISRNVNNVAVPL